MYTDPAWFNADFRSKLPLLEWRDKIRPTLRIFGPEAAVTFVLFDRTAPTNVPVPLFSSGEMAQILGLVSFNAFGGEPYAYDPAHHILPLVVDSHWTIMFGVVARHRDALDNYIDAYWSNAAHALEEYGPVMDGVARFSVWATPPEE